MAEVHEHMFYLIQHGNWNYFDVYDLPIKIRLWFVERLSKHFEEQNKKQEDAARKSRKS